MNKKLIIYTDGGARGNPGPAAIGVVIYNQSAKIVSKISKYIGDTTNNQAEYQALIEGLTEAAKLGGQGIDCYLDSELVVKQMQGKYKVREAGLKDLVMQALRLTAKFSRVDFYHIPREKNKLADKLVNEALNKAGH